VSDLGALPKNENSFPPRSELSRGKVNSLPLSSLSLSLSLSLSHSFAFLGDDENFYFSVPGKKSLRDTRLLKDYRYCATFKVAPTEMKRGKAIS